MQRIAGPSLPYDPTYHLPWRVDKIRRVVREERPDVLEVHSPYFALAGALAAGRGAAAVRTFFWHGDPIDTYARPLLAKRLSARAVDALLAPPWRAMAALLRTCDATFAAGTSQAEKLRALGVNTLHVPFGVDKAVFHPGARSEARRRELLAGAPEGTRLLVAVGRFAIEKRWDVVLDAFARARRHIDAVLVLFGDGPERDRMAARVRGRSDVRFVGFEKDRARLASALASADALVHACPYETFGLGIAEAMACALPVVVPDRGGAFEGIDARSSESYSALDVEACEAALRRLLARAPAALADGARAASAAVWTVEDHFDRTLDHYRELLARARRSERAAAHG